MIVNEYLNKYLRQYVDGRITQIRIGSIED